MLKNTYTIALDNLVFSSRKKISEACRKAVNEINKLSKNVASIKDTGIDRLNAFWPVTRDGKDVVFEMAATDWDGKTVGFSTKFLLVRGEAVINLDKIFSQKSDKKFESITDKKLVLIQQELQKFKNLLSNYSTKGAKALEREKDELFTLLKTLAVQAYNRAETLLANPDEEQTKLVADIISLKDINLAEINNQAAVLKNRIEKLDDSIKTPFLHLLYLNLLSRSGMSISSNNFEEVREQVKGVLASFENEINSLENSYDPELKKEWYRLNEEFYRVDEELTANYHDASNARRRQISIASKKIAFYRTLIEDSADKVIAESEQKITELRTELIEFAAIPLAKIASFRNAAVDSLGKATDIATRQLTQINDFGKQFSFTYPQLLSAHVRLPVMGDLESTANSVSQSIEEKLAEKKNAVIAYADAYRLAGIEGWRGAEDDVKKNVERILFEVKTALPGMKELDDLKDVANCYELNLVDKWQQLGDLGKEFEHRTIGYIEGSFNNGLSAIGDKVAGLIDPGVTVRQISAIKEKAYVLYNKVDSHKAAITSYAHDALTGEVARTGITDLKTFEKNIDKYLISKKDYLKEMLGNVKLFGLNIQGNISRDINFLPSEVPGASIKINRKNLVPVSTEIQYKWTSPPAKRLINDSDNSSLIRFINGNGTKDKSDNAIIEVDLWNKFSWEGDGSEQLKSRVGLRNFGIGAAGLIEIYFDQISMNKAIVQESDGHGNWHTSSDTSLDIKISKVNFKGFLELIQKLEEALGLGKGFLLDVSISGLKLSYGIRIPTISTGAFTMSNLTLYAGMVLSFTGLPPALRFAFADRSNPFTLAAGIFGGRGFFGMEVSSDGIKMVEGSLEYGGYVALDIAGIAKGQAYLMVGIYFRKEEGHDAYVEGYVTCGGSLSIIGIIQVSVVFTLSMSYQGKALVGHASVEVSISVLFFSASYTLHFERRIAGDSAYLRDGGNTDELYYAALNNEEDREKAILKMYERNRAQQNVVAYLYVEDTLTESKKKLNTEDIQEDKFIPIFDPTVLFELDMVFEEYCKQFGK